MVQIVKYAGLILIFFAFSYTGYLIYNSKRKRVKRIEGLLLLIRLIKQRAESFHEPLGDIYRNFENEALNEIGFCSSLREKGFSSAYEEYRASFDFDEFTNSSLEVFVISLGKLFLTEQIASCDYIIGQLEEKLSIEKAELPKAKKLWCTLGTLTGASVILLLL